MGERRRGGGKEEGREEGREGLCNLVLAVTFLLALLSN